MNYQQEQRARAPFIWIEYYAWSKHHLCIQRFPIYSLLHQQCAHIKFTFTMQPTTVERRQKKPKYAMHNFNSNHTYIERWWQHNSSSSSIIKQKQDILWPKEYKHPWKTFQLKYNGAKWMWLNYKRKTNN